MMTESMKTAIARVTEARAKIEAAEGKPMSDGQLVSRFLPVSATVWSRVSSGSYTGNNETVAAKLLSAAEDMEARVDALGRRAERSAAFVATRLAKATLSAWTKARDDAFGCKVVVVLAPTGAGKTAIGQHLANRHGSTYVEGKQSWQSSYKAFCADVAEAAGLPIHAKKYDERTAESQMLRSLSGKYGTLVIDEANTLGASTANAIKLICNKTNYTLVILAIPEMWDKFVAASTNEVKQVLNRCQAVLRHSEVPVTDVEQFLGKGFAGNRKDACKAIAAAANEFGAYKAVVRICADLDQVEGADNQDAEKAIASNKINIAGGK